jgi:cytochrome P450
MQRAVRARLDVFGRAAATGEVVQLAELAQIIALDVIVETVFGDGDIDRDTARKVSRDMIHGISPAIMGGTSLHRPWFPPWRRFVRTGAVFDRWVADVVRARRARPGGVGDDVLGVLLSARYDDGAPMDDAEVRDQIFTLLLAGHETSAIAMAWCIYYLLRNPASLARLRDEVDGAGLDTPEALTKLRYLDAAINEALRIEPIVTDVVRVCREPFTLAGRWSLPRGYVVAVMIGSILRDERVFENPRAFAPERFLEKKFGPSEFVPFGGGARRCLGAAFAQAELAIAVAEIVSSWELTLADSEPERAIRRNVTMGPRNGVRIRVVGRRRRPSVQAA